jgi:hypothetical protein
MEKKTAKKYGGELKSKVFPAIIRLGYFTRGYNVKVDYYGPINFENQLTGRIETRWYDNTYMIVHDRRDMDLFRNMITYKQAKKPIEK